ncbi:hypothetical protein JCM8547_005880 [Rhodosporidiobolus lusitaniae]
MPLSDRAKEALREGALFHLTFLILIADSPSPPTASYEHPERLSRAKTHVSALSNYIYAETGERPEVTEPDSQQGQPNAPPPAYFYLSHDGQPLYHTQVRRHPQHGFVDLNGNPVTSYRPAWRQ